MAPTAAVEGTREVAHQGTLPSVLVPPARRRAEPQRGQIILLFALLMPALIGFVGLAVDGGRILAERRHLQAVADAAAWAAAAEIVYGTPANAQAVAEWYTAQNGEATVTVSQPPTSGPYAGRSGYVSVQVESSLTLTLMQILHPAPLTVTVTSTAGPSPGPAPYALLALSRSAGGISLLGTTTVAVHNSSAASNNRISTVGVSSLTADHLLMAARGISGSAQGLRGTLPSTGPVPDPFGRLAAPPVPATTVASPSIDDNQVITVQPGHWTTDLIINGNNKQVTLSPGLYYFDQNKGISVTGATNSIVGDGVVIYLSRGSTINVAGGANLRLTAPTSPPYTGGPAGLLVFAARDNNSLVLDLNGGATTTLTGTVYAPGAAVRFTGGNASRLVHGQVLAGEVSFAGITSLAIDYDAALVAEQPRPTLLQ